MKGIKRSLILIIFIFCKTVVAQDKSYSKPAGNYFTEIPFSKQSHNADWKKTDKDVNLSFASSDLHYAKDEVPAIPLQKTWDVKAWKGEKLHTQILLWTNKMLPDVHISIGDLANEKGQRIGSKNINAGFVRYVMTDEFSEGCGHRKPENFDSSLVADAIDIISNIPVAANTVQPVWLSVNVPANTVAGTYKGSVTIHADQKYTLAVSLQVLEHRLMAPAEWKFDLDFWQHPAAIARIHGVKLWSDEHYKLMKPYYTMLANAGQKNITASIIHEPWNHQTYDDFPSLIKWIKRKDGSWYYDYSLFDKYVSFVMDCGINKKINCYSMVPWELSFQYFDEASGKDEVVKAKTGTPEYNDHWSAMLKDFAKHLKAKGWFSITSIAMDERPMKDMQAVIALLKNLDPDWKITLAGEYHREIEKDIYDYCIASNQQFDADVLQQRKAENKPTTYYTCCVEPYPNGFTFSPPAESTWIGWYAAAKGFTGYLRWAYNSWTKDPLRDSRFKTWPAGDTYQVYPGPRSSIRFEKLIEGIQDFEKIRILRENYAKQGKQSQLEKLDAVLAGFEIGKLKNIPATEMIQEAKAILNSY